MFGCELLGKRQVKQLINYGGYGTNMKKQSLVQLALSEYRANRKEGGSEENSRTLAVLVIRERAVLVPESEIRKIVDQVIDWRKPKTG